MISERADRGRQRRPSCRTRGVATVARDDGAAQVARAVDVADAVRQTSSCWRSDCGTASCIAAQRLAGSGDSTGKPRRVVVGDGPEERADPVIGRASLQPRQPGRRRPERVARTRASWVASVSLSAATSSAVQSSSWSGVPSAQRRSARRRVGSAAFGSGAGRLVGGGSIERSGATVARIRGSGSPSAGRRAPTRRRLPRRRRAWTRASAERDVLGRLRRDACGRSIGRRSDRLPRALRAAVGGTAGSLVPFAPCRFATASARLPRQSRPDPIRPTRNEADATPHGPAAPRHPATARRLPPRAAPDQALHVPAPDPGRGRRRSRLRRGVPLPRSQGADPPRRPRVGDADLQRLHGPAHLPSRRGLTVR